MSKAILVTGATGKQGGAVIDALIEQDLPNTTILALTRDANSAGAQRLKAKSARVKLVEGNLDDVPAIFAKVAAEDGHAQPIWGVYSVQVSMGAGVTHEGEIAQGKAVVDECIRAGVRHLVYSSVERGGDEASWDAPTPIPHFQSKHAVERHLRDATARGRPGQTLGWTVLRPVAFMDNLAPGFQTRAFLVALRNWLPADKPLQWVATADIGVFAAKAFAQPDRWNRKAVGLAGDELTFDQLSGVFERATGSPAPVAYSLVGSMLTYMVTELKLMIGWFASDGYRADIEMLRKEHPGMLTMEEWLVQRSPFDTKEDRA